MSKLKVQKVAVAGDRTLPVFVEFEKLVDRIRERAYELFAGRGYEEGHQLADWVAAEKEYCWPTAELLEDQDGYELRVALVGFKRRRITVTASPRELIVRATRKSKRKKRTATIRWSEFHDHDVHRLVELPHAIKVKKVTASFGNGLLKIRAPKAPATANRQ
ncbi:MAG: Hsp20 family protein [Chromatiales bacterium]|nr:MAG: Hsp20 family protein [Chromatiales bacterium]